MKRAVSIIFLLFPVFLNYLPFSQSGNGSLFGQTSINTTGAPADSSAMLDVDVSNKGILIPRVSLTSANDKLNIPSPAISLLIFNTSTAGTFPNNVVPGFYYWYGAKWVPLGSPAGINGGVGLLAFADFYALMPPDNSATIAQGSAVAFPHDGPTSGTDITRMSSTQFQLAAIGVYMISWQVSVAEAAQLILHLDTADIPSSVVGRATGTSQIVGNRLIETTVANSILSVVNPAGNPTAITITTKAGGAMAVSASLVITRLK
jgi:hypothetical protein